MIKKARFFKRKTALKKRSYNQEVALIKSNVKIGFNVIKNLVYRLFSFFGNVRKINYGKS